jgi:hypothetical protein
MVEELEDIEFVEVGGLTDEDIEDLAADDPELLTEVDFGENGNDLDDSDAEVDEAPLSAAKEFLVTERDN